MQEQVELGLGCKGADAFVFNQMSMPWRNLESQQQSVAEQVWRLIMPRALFWIARRNLVKVS